MGAVNLKVDLTGVANLIGAVEGASDTANSDAYMEDLLRCAHSEANDEFNMQIAATAAASGNFKHMYEWGTAGINNGRTTRRMNPMSEEARLWRARIEGNGRNLVTNFVFEPSKVPVPQPTSAKTGIAQKYLSRLQKGKAIFWNKASVMESGTQVTIAPKGKNKLFIPKNENPSGESRPSDVARGFVMTSKPVRTTPGEDTAGTFTAYWQTFWEGRGAEIVQEYVDEYVESDLQAVTEQAQRVTGRAATPSPSAFKQAVQAGRTRGKKTMKTRANRRKNGN